MGLLEKLGKAAKDAGKEYFKEDIEIIKENMGAEGYEGASKKYYEAGQEQEEETYDSLSGLLYDQLGETRAEIILEEMEKDFEEDEYKEFEELVLENIEEGRLQPSESVERITEGYDPISIVLERNE